MALSLASEGSNKAVTQEQFEHFLGRYKSCDEAVAEAVGARKDLRDVIKGAGGKNYLRAFDRARRDAEKAGADRIEEDEHYRRQMEWMNKPIGYQQGFDLTEGAPPPARLRLSSAELHEVDNEGYAAGKAGKRGDRCPWNPGTEPAERWMNAWQRGQAEKVSDQMGTTSHATAENGGGSPRRGRQPDPNSKRQQRLAEASDRPRRVLSEAHKAAMQAGRLAKKNSGAAAEREKLN